MIFIRQKMYYQRSRRRGRDWQEIRAKRTQSADFKNPETNLPLNPADNKESRRLSSQEIDQVLSDIRSRSTSRPPPPKATPPSLPPEDKNPWKSSRKSADFSTNPEISENEISSILKNHRRASKNSTFKNPDIGTDDESADLPETAESTSWVENPAYSSPIISSKKVKINPKVQPNSVPLSPKICKKKLKIHVCRNSAADSIKESVAAEEESAEEIRNEAGFKIQPNSVPVSHKMCKKKFKIHVRNNDAADSSTKEESTEIKIEAAVDHETAKLVENLKERLKSMDQDLDRVKAAALKINQDLVENFSDSSSADESENESEKQEYNATVHTKHISRSSSFVVSNQDEDKRIVSDLKLAANEW